MGTNQDFNMVLVTESGDTLTGVYLCVADQEHVDFLSAKLSAGSTYLSLKGPFNPNCYLGDISASTNTTINFRLNVPSGEAEGLINLRMLLNHDDGIYPNFHFEDQPALWYDLDELDAILWRDLEDF